MNDLQQLQERVQRMLDGEKKRREVALKWLQEVESILLDSAMDIWGMYGGANNYYDQYTVNVTKIDKDGNESDTSIYFRYVSSKGETEGFYDKMGNNQYNIDGESIEYLSGSEFWGDIKTIINWIPLVVKEIDNKEESRNDLLRKINIETERE
jgi:hypothetical protein